MIVKTSSVFCDSGLAPLCAGWVGQYAGPDGAKEARSEARHAEWKRKHGRDFCPSCVSFLEII